MIRKQLFMQLFRRINSVIFREIDNEAIFYACLQERKLYFGRTVLWMDLLVCL